MEVGIMKVQEFAELIEKQEKICLMKHKLDCAANWKNCETHIHYGKRWIRVDVGTSGRYMIDTDGKIYGIKAYGVPNKGRSYGTLDNPLYLGNQWGRFNV